MECETEIEVEGVYWIGEVDCGVEEGYKPAEGMPSKRRKLQHNWHLMSRQML